MSAPTSVDCARSLAVEALQSSGKLRLQVTGTSMLPTLWPGDLLRIQSNRSDLISTGDVVLFQREECFFIHRVVQASAGREASIITRGDCMVQDDPPISASDVLGRVVEVRRGTKAIAVKLEISPAQRWSGWLLSRWDLLHRVVLRIHSMRYSGNSRSPVSAVGTSA